MVCKYLIFVAWGARGPGFKSRRPDQTSQTLTNTKVPARTSVESMWSPNVPFPFRAHGQQLEFGPAQVSALHLSNIAQMGSWAGLFRMLSSQDEKKCFLI